MPETRGSRGQASHEATRFPARHEPPSAPRSTRSRSKDTIATGNGRELQMIPRTRSYAEPTRKARNQARSSPARPAPEAAETEALPTPPPAAKPGRRRSKRSRTDRKRRPASASIAPARSSVRHLFLELCDGEKLDAVFLPFVPHRLRIRTQVAGCIGHNAEFGADPEQPFNRVSHAYLRINAIDDDVAEGFQEHAQNRAGMLVSDEYVELLFLENDLTFVIQDRLDFLRVQRMVGNVERIKRLGLGNFLLALGAIHAVIVVLAAVALEFRIGRKVAIHRAYDADSLVAGNPGDLGQRRNNPFRARNVQGPSRKQKVALRVDVVKDGRLGLHIRSPGTPASCAELGFSLLEFAARL